MFEGSKHPFRLNFVKIDGKTIDEFRAERLAAQQIGGEGGEQVGVANGGHSLDAPRT